MMSERAIVNKDEFERIPSLSDAIGCLSGCVAYLKEADTTVDSEGVLIYIPFASPKDIINDLRGD